MGKVWLCRTVETFMKMQINAYVDDRLKKRNR